MMITSCPDGYRAVNASSGAGCTRGPIRICTVIPGSRGMTCIDYSHCCPIAPSHQCPTNCSPRPGGGCDCSPYGPPPTPVESDDIEVPGRTGAPWYTNPVVLFGAGLLAAFIVVKVIK